MKFLSSYFRLNQSVMRVFLLCLLFISFHGNTQELFKEEGLYGIKNDDGTVLIKPEYKELEQLYFDQGYIYKGFKNKSWYLLSNIEGIRNSDYEVIDEIPLVDGFLYCMNDKTMDIISLTDFNYIVEGINAESIEPNYLLEDDLMTIYLDQYQGLFNIRTGQVVIPPVYEELYFNDFSEAEELAYVGVKDDLYTILSVSGKVTYDNIPYEIVGADFIDSAKTGISIYTSKFNEGYISLEGNYIIEPKYDYVMPSKNEVKFVTVVGKKGEGIAWNGVEVLKPKYESTFVSENPNYIGEVIIKDVVFWVNLDGSLEEKTP